MLFKHKNHPYIMQILKPPIAAQYGKVMIDVCRWWLKKGAKRDTSNYRIQMGLFVTGRKSIKVAKSKIDKSVAPTSTEDVV